MWGEGWIILFYCGVGSISAANLFLSISNAGGFAMANGANKHYYIVSRP